jgi:hypothetical protein
MDVKVSAKKDGNAKRPATEGKRQLKQIEDDTSQEDENCAIS